MRLLAAFAAAGLILVGVWLDYRRQMERGEPGARESEGIAPASAEFATPSSELTGYRADLGHLPDAPLLGFVEIAEGPFLMGSDPGIDTLAYDVERWSADRPQGAVDVPPFLIGRSEVTVAQFAAFVEAAGHEVDPQALAGSPLHPVSFVSWPDALAYCRWLEELLRESPATPPEVRSRLAEGWRVTLPSEAQWEKAARGGDGRIFPWGNELRRDRANFATGRPVPVGEVACPECPHGLQRHERQRLGVDPQPLAALPLRRGGRPGGARGRPPLGDAGRIVRRSRSQCARRHPGRRRAGRQARVHRVSRGDCAGAPHRFSQ